jgi:hypothetical protein
MKKIFLILFAITILMPSLVSAQGLKDAGKILGETDVGLTSDLPVAVNQVIDMVFYITGTVFLLLIIYGGFVYLKSTGRENEIDRAKKILYTSIVGLVIITASYAITNLVLNRAG